MLRLCTRLAVSGSREGRTRLVVIAGAVATIRLGSLHCWAYGLAQPV